MAKAKPTPDAAAPATPATKPATPKKPRVARPTAKDTAAQPDAPAESAGPALVNTEAAADAGGTDAVEAPLAAAPAGFETPRAPDLPPLPHAYGEDRVVMMPRNPEGASVYWEITADGVGRARALLGDAAAEAQLTLRLYRIDEGDDPATAAEVIDAPITDWIGRDHVGLARPGARLVASVGFQAQGAFVHIARSTPLRLPRRSAGSEPIRQARFTLAGAAPSAEPAPARRVALEPEAEPYEKVPGSLHLRSRGPGA